jgi:hypothetical protein
VNDNTRKTKIAEMAVVLLAAHLGLPAAIISVDINGIDVFLGRRHVQVKVARAYGRTISARVATGGSGTAQTKAYKEYRKAHLVKNISSGQSKDGYAFYGPRSKADLYFFVALTFDKPFAYEFWVATAAEVAHAKSGVAMRDEWRLENRMPLLLGEAAA